MEGFGLHYDIIPPPLVQIHHYWGIVHHVDEDVAYNPLLKGYVSQKDCPHFLMFLLSASELHHSPATESSWRCAPQPVHNTSV